jgi:hypothetical protein
MCVLINAAGKKECVSITSDSFRLLLGNKYFVLLFLFFDALCKAVTINFDSETPMINLRLLRSKLFRS